MTRLVLIVDDSPQVAANLQIALEGLPGLDIAVAACGQDALAMMETLPVAALITDLEMPKMDGYQLIHHLRSDPRFSELPIIVSSGVSDPDAPSRVLASGADAYFAKPYSPAELRTRLQHLLCGR